jgi:hypothetical protein
MLLFMYLAKSFNKNNSLFVLQCPILYHYEKYFSFNSDFIFRRY